MTQPLRKPFGNAGAVQPHKYPPPFSLRLSEEENARLRDLAQGMSLSAYIRKSLFGKETTRERFAKATGVEVSTATDLQNGIGKLFEHFITSNIYVAFVAFVINKKCFVFK